MEPDKLSWGTTATHGTERLDRQVCRGGVQDVCAAHAREVLVHLLAPFWDMDPTRRSRRVGKNTVACEPQEG